MQRRDFLKAGASVFAIPAAWAQHAAKLDWTPQVLDAHQNETVIVLTELIIPATDTPGAKAARVNRYVDLFLRDGDAAQREQFLDGLNWLDGYTIREHGHPFVNCSAQQQTATLRQLQDGIGVGHQFFKDTKSLTAKIYYATEIGYQELNKGGRVPSWPFDGPVCDHGSHA